MLWDNTGNKGSVVKFDLSDGAYNSTGVINGGLTVVDYGSDPLGDDWYRVWASWTTGATNTDYYAYTYILDASFSRSYTAGTEAIYVAHNQLETGSVPTSLIITAGSTVTRAADQPTIALSKLPFNTTEGTLVNAHTLDQHIAGDRYVVQISDGGSGKRILSYRAGSGDVPTMYVGNSGTQAYDEFSTTPSEGTETKHAFAWKENDFGHSVNGGTAETDNSGTVPSGLDVMEIGHSGSGGGNQLNDGISFIKYLPRRITNANLQSETAT
jgi:hypothetical protein